MCIHASHTSSSMKREPSFGPQLNGRAPVFSVQVMLSMWCYMHVPHVNEARLWLWHAHLVCLDCSSSTVPACCCGSTEIPRSYMKKRGKMPQLENMLPSPLANQQEWKHSSVVIRLQVVPGLLNEANPLSPCGWLTGPCVDCCYGRTAFITGSHGNRGQFSYCSYACSDWCIVRMCPWLQTHGFY